MQKLFSKATMYISPSPCAENHTESNHEFFNMLIFKRSILLFKIYASKLYDVCYTTIARNMHDKYSTVSQVSIVLK